METGGRRTFGLVFYGLGLVLAALATWGIYDTGRISLARGIFGAIGLVVALLLALYFEDDDRLHRLTVYGLMALGLGMLLPTILRAFSDRPIFVAHGVLSGIGLLLSIYAFLRL